MPGPKLIPHYSMMYRVAGAAQKHVFAAILHRPLALLNIIERRRRAGQTRRVVFKRRKQFKAKLCSIAQLVNID
jgi:hypothetical protein